MVGLRAAVAASVAAAALGLAPAAAGAATPEITVRPSTDLVDDQEVVVRGRGFQPNVEIMLFECLAERSDEQGCDFGTVDFLTTTADGTFVTTWAADRVLNSEEFGHTDCARADCVLAVTDWSSPQPLATHPLAFDPDAPLPHPLRVDLTVRRVALLREGGRVVMEGTITCNRRADGAVFVTLSQEGNPDVVGYGETFVVCGEEQVWRLVVQPYEGDAFAPRHAVATVYGQVFAGEDQFAEDTVVSRLTLGR